MTTQRLIVYLPTTPTLMCAESRRLVTKLCDSKLVEFKVVSDAEWMAML